MTNKVVPMTEINAIAYMRKNKIRTIKQWAEELKLSPNRAASIYQKCIKLGIMDPKGHDSERSRKMAFIRIYQHKVQQLKQEIA